MMKIEKDTVTRREIHTAGAELRVLPGEGDASGRTIEGYAILFDSPSLPFVDSETQSVREIIDRSAVTRELLDRSDIKMTLFHDNQQLLARSKQGEGSLGYDIDERGVRFRFEAPRTADGEKALELVRRGVIDGCSFAFSTRYRDEGYVRRTVETVDGKSNYTFRVMRMLGIHDFTLTPDPAYPATTVSTRELIEGTATQTSVAVGGEGTATQTSVAVATEEGTETAEREAYYAEMRLAASHKI